MKIEERSVLVAVAREMKLVYVSADVKGYTRLRKGKGFVYADADGNRITDAETLQRIKSLVIPPAWTNVWINPKPNGHLQVTGIDAAGRKQYKYHSEWSKHRNVRKHSRMVDFARSLPALRKRLNKDLRKRDFTREKVLALAITVMDKTCIRVGNSAYTKMYGSYGLTSLRNKHVQIKGSKMVIAFKGKKGVYQEIKLTHARLTGMMKKLRDIPGQELFQYYDEKGEKHVVDSSDVNSYIMESTGKDFTAKDFRTWWGTVSMFGSLAEAEDFETITAARQQLNAALEQVAAKLGNTKTVCKKYYIHPSVFEHYEQGRLSKYLQKLKKMKGDTSALNTISPEEQVTMEYMLCECKA